MEFCDNKKQLFQAYFRDFTIERLEYPWQAFTGGWYVCAIPFFHRSLSLSVSAISNHFERWPTKYYIHRQPEVAARKLGINSSFIKGDYCYVLVRVSRFRETARLMRPIPPNQVLQDDVSANIQNMTLGNSTETVQFMTNFGTHYINSYVTGNSLYQVRFLIDLFFFVFSFFFHSLAHFFGYAITMISIFLSYSSDCSQAASFFTFV